MWDYSIIFSFFFFFFFFFFFLSAADQPLLSSDKFALLSFPAISPHTHILNWNSTTSPCNNWTGVFCNGNNSRVTALCLPGIGFTGTIQFKPLARLSALQILSLRSNAFNGYIPSQLFMLSSLTALYLQNNKFSGKIPPFVSNLTNLLTLDLSSNPLSGEIPDLYLPNLKFLNLSCNNFTGRIPPSLLRFPNSSFAGNKISSFALLQSKKLSHVVFLGFIAAGCVVVFAALGVSMLFYYLRLKDESLEMGKKMENGCKEGRSRLVFFDVSMPVFDMEDLLRASAEVIGKGTFGAAYKAVLEDGTAVVVKRLKEVGVGRMEFEQQMEVVGRVLRNNPTLPEEKVLDSL